MKSLRRWVSLSAMWLAAAGCNSLIEAGNPEVVDGPSDADADGETPPGEDALCGNGVKDPGEQCDDGNDEPSDGCDGCQTDCGPFPEVLNTSSGRCYLYQLDKVKTWAEAETDCEAWGGQLTAPTTLDELGFVQQHLLSDTWIGGRAPANSASFEWVTGEEWELDVQATFTPQPAVLDHDTCALIDGEKLGLRQAECDIDAGYICEKPYLEVE